MLEQFKSDVREAAAKTIDKYNRMIKLVENYNNNLDYTPIEDYNTNKSCAYCNTFVIEKRTPNGSLSDKVEFISCGDCPMAKKDERAACMTAPLTILISDRWDEREEGELSEDECDVLIEAMRERIKFHEKMIETYK